jgi:hypothetical protein
MSIYNKRIEEITREVWKHGTYLSTRVLEYTVVNSYAYEDFIIDIVYCVAKGIVVAVDVDDSLELSLFRLSCPGGFNMHLN